MSDGLKILTSIICSRSLSTRLEMSHITIENPDSFRMCTCCAEHMKTCDNVSFIIPPSTAFQGSNMPLLGKLF